MPCIIHPEQPTTRLAYLNAERPIAPRLNGYYCDLLQPVPTAHHAADQTEVNAIIDDHQLDAGKVDDIAKQIHKRGESFNQARIRACRMLV